MKKSALRILLRAAPAENVPNPANIEKSMNDIRKTYLKIVWINACMLTRLSRQQYSAGCGELTVLRKF